MRERGCSRATFGSCPDMVCGFLPDGRLPSRFFDLDPFGASCVLVSAPLDGGQVREEVRVSRLALLDEPSHLVIDGNTPRAHVGEARGPGDATGARTVTVTESGSSRPRRRGLAWPPAGRRDASGGNPYPRREHEHSWRARRYSDSGSASRSADADGSGGDPITLVNPGTDDLVYSGPRIALARASPIPRSRRDSIGPKRTRVESGMR
jgi:hypothetical protein